MKTAMQELIEKLAMKTGDSFNALAFYHDNDEIIKESLEKEKEQIIHSYNDGVNDGNTQGLLGKEGNCNYSELEEYYNQTYNQNK